MNCQKIKTINIDKKITNNLCKISGIQEKIKKKDCVLAISVKKIKVI